MPEKSYKNIRLREHTFQQLKEEKRDYETWDGMMHRVLDMVQSDE